MSRARGSDGTMSIVSRIEQLARVGRVENIGQERSNLVDLREPLQDRDKPPVLALRRLGFDDVVVEVIGAVAWSYGEKLRPGRMHEDTRNRPISDDTWTGMAQS